MATIQHGEAQNKLGNPNGKPSYSTFPIRKHRYTTERFGINDVCGVFNGIEADQIDWAPKHELTTYTLSAPLMTPVYKEKDYIAVARQAILPKNWNKIHVQPNIGEDIDATKIGTSVSANAWEGSLINFINKTTQRIKDTYTKYTQGTLPTGEEIFKCLEDLLRNMVLREYIVSYGSLLAKMGAKFASLYKSPEGQPYDIAFDLAIIKIKSYIDAIDVFVGNDEYLVMVREPKENEQRPSGFISLREFLDYLRENPGNFYIEKIYEAGTEYKNPVDRIHLEDTDAYMDNIYDTIVEHLGWNVYQGIYEKPVDLVRLWAYQLANAEYYTNSHVDHIYSAELYRQWVMDRILQIDNTLGANKFTWNGVSYEYDYLSAYYTETALELATENEMWEEGAEYLATIFSWRRSLKYLDYFTGSKTRPLAVGDVTINPGVGGTINVIDVTRKGQAYKFLNAVNRIQRKAEDYALEIMGVKQQHDWHNPLWLASTRTAVTANVTDNTGEAQMKDENAQTARLYGVDGRYKFNFNLDRDTIIVGITFYDVERSYFKGIHRSFMHVDRYDMYNPYLQYTGDQEIYGEEFAAGQKNTFGYVPSYEEFKQEYNTADAGFVVALPGYTFLDGMYNNNREGGEPNGANHIGPNFLRSKPVEFDRFYNSLTGYSLGTYFHFILDYYNELNAKRKMAFNPGVGI